MSPVLAPTPLHSSFLVLFLSEQTGPAGGAELRPLTTLEQDQGPISVVVSWQHQSDVWSSPRGSPADGTPSSHTPNVSAPLPNGVYPRNTKTMG